MKPKTLLTLKLAAGLDLSSSACEDLHRMQRLALEALAEETSDLKTPAAPVPLPLGPNVLRDGRKARVLCNDFQNGGRCVIVALKTSSGNENTSYHFADGRVNLDGTDSPSDLVGHLPPEPAKPREVWLRFHKDSAPEVIYGLTPVSTPPFHLFREVLPGQDDELERLREWKRQAMESTPDWWAIGKEMGLTLGQDVPSKVLSYIQSLKAQLARSTQQ